MERPSYFDAVVEAAGQLVEANVQPIQMPGETPQQVNDRSVAALANAIVEERGAHPLVNLFVHVGRQLSFLVPNNYKMEDARPKYKSRRKRG